MYIDFFKLHNERLNVELEIARASKQPLVATANNTTTYFLWSLKVLLVIALKPLFLFVEENYAQKVLQGIFYSVLDVDMLIKVQFTLWYSNMLMPSS